MKKFPSTGDIGNQNSRGLLESGKLIAIIHLPNFQFGSARPSASRVRP